MRSRFIKNTALVFMFILGLINRFIPKKKHRILLFTNNRNYNDNNKALLKQLSELELNKTYQIIFCSSDYKTKKTIEQITYAPVYYAPFLFLTSKYCFYDAGTLKIKPSKQQKVIALGHGIPLKKIGLQVGEQSSFLDRYNDFTRIIVPHINLKKIFIEAFGCTKEQILINGYPKNDFLFKKNPTIWTKLNIEYNKFTKTLIWMPTFRDSLNGRYQDGGNENYIYDIPLIYHDSDFLTLNNYLALHNILLVIKPHPYSTLNQTLPTHIDLSHIIFITNHQINKLNIINYSFVGLFDGLITDYSSVIFDYLLTDNPIAFTNDDIESYSDNRGLNFPELKNNLPGPEISSLSDFQNFINNFAADIDLFTQERKSVSAQFHTESTGQATTMLLQKIGIIK